MKEAFSHNVQVFCLYFPHSTLLSVLGVTLTVNRHHPEQITNPWSPLFQWITVHSPILHGINHCNPQSLLFDDTQCKTTQDLFKCYIHVWIWIPHQIVTFLHYENNNKKELMHSMLITVTFKTKKYFFLQVLLWNRKRVKITWTTVNM